MEQATSDSDPQEYAKENYSHRPQEAMLSPAPPLASFKREGEPWRGSSGFGLADILNRSSASAGAVNAGAAAGSALPLPKFSLPALHSFSKPIAKPELHVGHEGPQRSILNDRNDSSYEYTSSNQPKQQPQALHSSTAISPDSRPSATDRDSTPMIKSGNASNSSRRIAPAPVDEEDGDQEEELSSSIRGGRWTADEHERFLEGFRIHGHKWKRVQQVVRTRSVTQVRTHAQKYLLKVAKMKAEKKPTKSGEAEPSDRFSSPPGRADSSSDTEANNASMSSPDHSQEAASQDDVNHHRSPKRSQRKKIRKLEHGVSDPIDQEYIAAAATTLCFLMSQSFDSRHDLDSTDVEPYDCYSQDQEPQYSSQTADSPANSRKRTYMHFITESPGSYTAEGVDYRGFDNGPRAEASSYSIQGNKLCS